MDRIVPITEAKNQLSALVHEAETDERDVVLVRHGRPAAVLVGAARYEAIIEGYQDALDRLSVYETANEAVVPLDELTPAAAGSA